jgi:hypothetical protein
VYPLPDEIIIEAPNITPEEYKKYRGKDVAIYNGKIVASGRTSTEAFNNAKKKYPEAKTEEIEIFYIQISDELIL